MKELAQQYGFQYVTVTADIDEQALGDRTSDPAELVTLLAQAKADAICACMRDDSAAELQGLLLTCDQVVIYQGTIREKPTSMQQVLICAVHLGMHHAAIFARVCAHLLSLNSCLTQYVHLIS